MEQQMTDRFDSLETQIKEVGADLKEVASDVRDILVHQKELNGSVADNAKCVVRLTQLTDDLMTHQREHCARIAVLEATGRYRDKAQDKAKEARDWTRDKLWSTAETVAGLAAKLGIILAVVIFLIQNLPQIIK